MIGTALALEKQKTCCDCKKQQAESSFPKQKNRKGLYTYMTRCAPCLAIFRASYRTKAEKTLYKICRDCKRQDLYENFPKQKNASGNYYALPRCSDCHAKVRVEYRKENMDDISKYGKRWRAQHPGYKQSWRHGDARVIQRLNKFYENAKQRNLSVQLSEKEITDLFNSECYYCGDRPEGLCGVDRSDPRFGYLQNNVVAACTVCNFNKQSLSNDEFFAWVTKIAKRHTLMIQEG